MSQAGIINTTSGPVPPIVPTTFQGQNGGVNDGSAQASGNIINFNTSTSTTNTTNGLVVAASGSTVTYSLTNRAVGSTTTTGNTSSQVINLPLGAVPGVYTFDIVVAGFAKTGVGSPLGCGYTIVGSVRTTGAAATLIPNQQVDHFEEGLLSTALTDVAMLNVTGNSAIVVVTGASDGAAGFLIDWQATLNYTFTS